jgi:hypothetical protein
MTHMQNITENYSVEIATSTDSGDFTKGLIASMQQTKDLVTRRMLRDMLWGARPEGINEIVHGVSVADSKGSQEPTQAHIQAD